MRLKRFEQHLRTLTSKVYKDKAPAGETEYILWHRYGSSVVIGDDAVCLAADKLQLDVIWQSEDSSLAEDLKALLVDLRLPWDEISYGWDDDWLGYRCILQTELV